MDFVRSEGGSTELTTLLPVAVMGPVLGTGVSGANRLVQQILAGDLPGFPNSYVPVVDVRDVAAARVAALTAAGAEGQRILLASNDPPLALAEIGALLRDRPRSAEEAVLAAARSLVARSLVGA